MMFFASQKLMSSQQELMMLSIAVMMSLVVVARGEMCTSANGEGPSMDELLFKSQVVMMGRVVERYSNPQLPTSYTAEVEVFCVYKGGPLPLKVNVTNADPCIMKTCLYLFLACSCLVLTPGAASVADSSDVTAATQAHDAYPPAGMASSCPPIVSRAEWEARDPSPALVPLKAQPTHVYIHHGATPPDGCHSPGLCAAMVRAYQNFHMFSHGWSDIGYSFLVGEDGRAYEGRGWTNVGAHTKGHNEDGLGFCVIGDFTARIPDQVALTTLKALIQCGVDSGYLPQDYVMFGHRDMGDTECPGDRFYAEIRTWPHYNSTR